MKDDQLMKSLKNKIKINKFNDISLANTVK